jgi:hypothetical protein
MFGGDVTSGSGEPGLLNLVGTGFRNLPAAETRTARASSTNPRAGV